MKTDMKLLKFYRRSIYIDAIIICLCWVACADGANTDDFPVIFGERYEEISSINSRETLVLKKRNEIWIAFTNQPELLLKLPGDEVWGNSNMIAKDGYIYVAHNERIYEIEIPSANWREFVEGISVTKLLGFDFRGGLYALVSSFSGEESGSLVRTELMVIDRDGNIRTVDVGKRIIYSASISVDGNRLAIGFLDRIRVYSLQDLQDITISDCYCVKNVSLVSERALVYREGCTPIGNVYFEDIAQKTVKLKVGTGFSSITASGSQILGLRDDSSIYCNLNLSGDRWELIASVTGCDNEKYDSSYSQAPIVSPSGHNCFFSLACHRKDNESGKYITAVQSFVVNLENRQITKLGGYYEQACWVSNDRK